MKPEETSKKAMNPEVSLPYFPTIVNVEVFRGACNCSCVHCPLGVTPPNERRARFGRKEMTLELFGKICAEMSVYYNTCLRIHAVGEPLLWSNLVPALRMAKHYGVKTWLFTCGVTRNESIVQQLAELTDILEVSVNSSSREDYLRTKGIDYFELVQTNITKWGGEIAQGKNGCQSKLLVSRVQTNDSQADEEFVSFWSSTGLVHEAFVRSYHNYNDLLCDGVGYPTQVREPCRVHWTRFNISCDGYAVLCFNELFRRMIREDACLGDLTKVAIHDIWHGKSLTAIRRNELQGFMNALPQPCVDCRYWQPLFGDGEVSEKQLGFCDQC